MTIAIYSRKSKQTDTGESVRNQMQMCRDYAEANFGSAQFLLYEDEGFSGGTTDRPAFHRMINDARQKKFDKLICYRLDRISRSVVDFSSSLELLSQKAIDFISISEHFDTGTPIGRAMMYIASVFAQLERETIAERIRDNLLRLARTGRWLGGVAPYGFTSLSEKYTTEEGTVKKKSVLLPNPAAIPQVERIFKRYLEVRTVTALVKALKQEGLKTEKDTFYCQRTLSQMLCNPVYVQSNRSVYEYFETKGVDIVNPPEDFDGNGLMLCNKHVHKSNKHRIREVSQWIIAVGNHPGIIPAHQWLEAQALLEANRMLYTRGRAGTSQVGLLGSLLVCGVCGGKLRIMYRKKEPDGSAKFYYYKCSQKAHNPDGCTISNLNGRQADQAVLHALNELASQNSRLRIAALTALKKELPTEAKSSVKRKESLAKQSGELYKKIDRLTEQLAQPDIDPTIRGYILRQIKKYDEEIQSVERLMEIDSQQEKQIFNPESNSTVLGDNQRDNDKERETKSTIEEMDFSTKKTYLKELIKEIIWDGEKLEIRLNL